MWYDVKPSFSWKKKKKNILHLHEWCDAQARPELKLRKLCTHNSGTTTIIQEHKKIATQINFGFALLYRFTTLEWNRFEKEEKSVKVCNFSLHFTVKRFMVINFDVEHTYACMSMRNTRFIIFYHLNTCFEPNHCNSASRFIITAIRN